MTAPTARTSDWKVTVGHRLGPRAGWALVTLAVFVAVVAARLDSVGAWWAVAGLAALVMVGATHLPEPVPSDLLVEGRTRVDSGPLSND